VVYDTTNAKVLFTDASGKIEISTKDGHRTLLATSLQGETVFTGAIDTAEQVSSVPEDIRKKVAWLEEKASGVVNNAAEATPADIDPAKPVLAEANVL